MTQYNLQLLCAKWCGKIYTIIFFGETDSYWVVTIVWLIVYYIIAEMFGLDWFVVLVVWSGVGNINFPNENGLVWV